MVGQRPSRLIDCVQTRQVDECVYLSYMYCPNQKMAASNSVLPLAVDRRRFEVDVVDESAKSITMTVGLSLSLGLIR